MVLTGILWQLMHCLRKFWPSQQYPKSRRKYQKSFLLCYLTSATVQPKHFYSKIAQYKDWNENLCERQALRSFPWLRFWLGIDNEGVIEKCYRSAPGLYQYLSVPFIILTFFLKLC